MSPETLRENGLSKEFKDRVYIEDNQPFEYEPYSRQGIVSILNWSSEKYEGLTSPIIQDVSISNANKERLKLLAREYANQTLNLEEQSRLSIVEEKAKKESKKAYEKSMESLNSLEEFLNEELSYLDSLDEL